MTVIGTNGVRTFDGR